MKKYPLTISVKYAQHWGYWEAIRELLQNAKDQCTLNPESQLIFHYCGETLYIGNTRSRIPVETLILGNGDKSDNRELIGQHGEGFKLALLVLARYLTPVVVYNGDVEWSVAFEHNELFQTHLLTITETPASQTFDGVLYVIGGITQEIYDDVVSKFLPNVSCEDEILFEDFQKGKVYVAGLFVCEIPALEYGYSFSPGTISLDRDRGLVPTFEVTSVAAKLWSKTTDLAKLYAGLSKGSLDTQYVRDLPEETSQYVRDRFVSANPHVTPVSTQEESELHENPFIVPSVLKNVLHRVHDFVIRRKGTPEQKLISFKNRFQFWLDDDGQRELDTLIKESRGWV